MLHTHDCAPRTVRNSARVRVPGVAMSGRAKKMAEALEPVARRVLPLVQEMTEGELRLAVAASFAMQVNAGVLDEADAPNAVQGLVDLADALREQFSIARRAAAEDAS